MVDWLRIDVGASVSRSDIAATVAALLAGRPVVWVGRERVLTRAAALVLHRVPGAKVSLGRWMIGDDEDEPAHLSDLARAQFLPPGQTEPIVVDAHFTREQPVRRSRPRRDH